MLFCTGIPVLISTRLPEAKCLLFLSHDTDSPGKLSMTVQMRESDSPPLGDTCGPVKVTVGGTERKKKSIVCLYLNKSYQTLSKSTNWY